MNRAATAIARKRLSTPMSALRRRGLLTGTVLDYGCGRGDDVRLLRRSGVRAFCFDPTYYPTRPEPADVVSLGYVLNVIEDPEERAQVLRKAWKLARRTLCVAVRPGGRPPGHFRRYRDGWVSSTGHFQKLYTQDELVAYMRDTLGREPEVIGPGIVLVHRERPDTTPRGIVRHGLFLDGMIWRRR